MLNSLTSRQQSRAYSSSSSVRSMDAVLLSSACWIVCSTQLQRSRCWTWSCSARSCRYTSMQAAVCGTRFASCLAPCHHGRLQTAYRVQGVFLQVLGLQSPFTHAKVRRQYKHLAQQVCCMVSQIVCSTWQHHA